MFTIKPAKKNGLSQAAPTNGNGNGHKNGNGHGGNGNGHKKGNGHAGGIETVIGPGLFVRGALNGNGGARIEGNFEGTINLKGALVVAEGSHVTAEIQAESVTVAGHVKGNIRAGKVEILAAGRIWGDLTTTAFSTEEGAFLRGQVTMQEKVEITPPPPVPIPAEAPPEPVAAGEAPAVNETGKP